MSKPPPTAVFGCLKKTYTFAVLCNTVTVMVTGGGYTSRMKRLALDDNNNYNLIRIYFDIVFFIIRVCVTHFLFVKHSMTSSVDIVWFVLVPCQSKFRIAYTP